MDPSDERIVRLLANGRNRTILTVLDEAAQPLTVSELASRLVVHDASAFGPEHGEDDTAAGAAGDREDDATAGAAGDRGEIRIALHHDHLPKLDEAGLVDYDRDENVVSSEECATIDVERSEIELLDGLLSRFGSGTEIDDESVEVLEGHEDVIEYGRHLAGEADDELFLMFATEDLLEEGCLRHARDAIDRGVDVYLGSRNPNVRDIVRESLPEVTIWEPRLDLGNVPSRYPKVGRLVFADREEIMIALLDERDDDGAHPETAVVGDGERNPLVVLVRELLGTRLDHLDYQSEDFLDQLPFES